MSLGSRNIARGITAVRLLVAASILTFGAGCAYFNTLYNAKKNFREAQETPRMKDGSLAGQAQEKYGNAIEKSEALIASYPDSKYVDDAVLLIGKCLFEQGEYDDAIARFDELDTLSTDNDLKREGRLFKAKSYAGKGDLEAVVAVARPLVDENPKKATDEAYFLLGTSLVKMENEAEAVKYLEMLAERYPKSPYRVRADLEAAEVYAERGDFERSVGVYMGLQETSMSDADRVRYLSGLGEVYADMGEYQKSIDVLRTLDAFVLDPTEKAGDLLVTARAWAGLDSMDAAIRTYKTVATSYPRSLYSAEAHYRLGEIYQDALDSLDVARQEFDQVPQQYAQSEFAEDAISRSAAISKLTRLRESLASGEGGDQQMTQFDLAEVELFQLKNYPKALESYQKLLADYPDGDYAPRSAFAIAYIYEAHLKDAEKAKAAYEHIVSRYPNSQQAQYARGVLGLPPLPAVERPPASAAPSDSVRTARADTTSAARPDTTSTERPDSSSAARPDTSSVARPDSASTAPADTTSAAKPDSASTARPDTTSAAKPDTSSAKDANQESSP